MNEKKPIKISLSAFFLIIAIIVIVVMGIVIFKISEEKTKKEEMVEKLNSEVIELESTVEDLQGKIDSMANTVNSDKTNSKINFNEGIYLFSLDENRIDKINGFLEYIAKQKNIKFSNGEFTSNISDDMAINGKYEVLENKKLKCTLKNYTFKDDENTNTISLEEKNWTINFIIENDKEIKVESSDFGKSNTEINILLNDIFVKGYEFVSYDEYDFVGQWKSSKAASYYDVDGKWNEEELASIFGTSYIQAGSTFTFNSDKTFKDYVFPVTEGDKYRNGTYTFDGLNKFTLKYSDDDSYYVEIYIMNKDKIVYKNGDNLIFMK